MSREYPHLGAPHVHSELLKVGIDTHRSGSRHLLPMVDWEATQDSNVSVLNDTADYYRFFDATPYTEFLYACVRQTV